MKDGAFNKKTPSRTFQSPRRCGAGGRTRTGDLLITNQLLYQLSHTSKIPLYYNDCGGLCQVVFYRKINFSSVWASNGAGQSDRRFGRRDRASGWLENGRCRKRMRTEQIFDFSGGGGRHGKVLNMGHLSCYNFVRTNDQNSGGTWFRPLETEEHRMELTLAILLLLAFIASRTGRSRRKKARRARCARLSEETRAARGAQVISIEECAARCGRTLYEKRRMCR